MKERMLIGGKWVVGSEDFEVINPYNGAVIARIPKGTAEDVGAAVECAVRGFEEVSKLPAHARSDILLETSMILLKRREEIGGTIAKESGKPLKYALAEVERAAETFRFASEEAKRIHGETIPMGASKGSENRVAFYERFPIGPVGAITPFNFPLNLVAHKVAPAVAAGNSVVLKPAEQTPLTALMLGEIMLDAGLPPNALNIVTGDGETGSRLVTDDRLRMITFTGSPPVGREIKSRAGMKKVTLELGSNSGVIVEPDADIDAALSRSLMGAFANSGQVCISLQRIYLHRDVYNRFRDGFVDMVGRLKSGDPLDPETDIGPLIDEGADDRTRQWIDEAVAGGARVLCGGKGDGRFFEPTVLENTSRDMKVICSEVFAPVVSLIPYESFNSALEMVNDSVYGLHAGVYTGDIGKAFDAFRKLEVGGVIINDVPTYRADHMPYGGVKESGLGREGLRYSIEEMTEIKTMVLNL